MFEKEIKFISDFCLNKVKQLGSSFAFENLAGSDLHPAITRYISAELDFMIYSDRKKLLEQSYFDYTGLQINQHFSQISEEIKRSKRISLDDTEKLIVQAVSFNANFVVRPKWSLIKLIYNDQNSVAVDELEVMLKYVYYYDYIKNVLGAYLSKRKVVQLSLTEFELILNKIDRELFKTNSEQLIDNALSSIGDFFNIGGTDRSSVSPTAVEILLKEKNLIDHLMKLRRAVPDSGKKKLTFEEIKKILYIPAQEEEQIFTEEEEEKLLEEEPAESITFDDLEKSFTGDELEIPTDDSNVGELADKFAAEMDEAGLGNFLTEEDEDKLLSLYDEELEKIENDFNSPEFSEETDTDEIEKIDDSNKENIEVEPFYSEENPEEIKDELTEQSSQIVAGKEKEIVDEMLKDFLGEDIDNKNLAGENIAEQIDSETKIVEDQIANETALSDMDEIDKMPEAEQSLEDELMDVFEEIENLDAEPVENEIIKDEEPLSEFDQIDKDLETIDELVFGEKEKPEELLGVISASATEELIENNKPITEELNETVDENIEDLSDKLNEVDEIVPEEKNEELSEPVIVNKTEQRPQRKVVQKVKEIEESIPLRSKDLLSYLKRKDIKKIISYIFSGDREDFVTTAERIMECRGYKEASEIIRSVFSSYKISHYSKEAITFTNAVSNYFRQA